MSRSDSLHPLSTRPREGRHGVAETGRPGSPRVHLAAAGPSSAPPSIAPGTRTQGRASDGEEEVAVVVRRRSDRLMLVATACGGDDAPGGNRHRRARALPARSPSRARRPWSRSRRWSPSCSRAEPRGGDHGRRARDRRRVRALLHGEIDIADASRAIDEDEIAACKDGGIEYQELEVALDGITVMVNSASTIECLTTADLYAIFGPESDGHRLDGRRQRPRRRRSAAPATCPTQDLEITAPGEESGTYDAFIDLVGIEDYRDRERASPRTTRALRSDYQSSPNDNVIIQAMRGEPERDRVRRVRVRREGGRRGEGGRGSTQGTDASRRRPRRSPTPATRCPARCTSTPTRQTAGDGRGRQGVRRLLPDRRGLVTGGRGGGVHRAPRGSPGASLSAWESAVS